MPTMLPEINFVMEREPAYKTESALDMPDQASTSAISMMRVLLEADAPRHLLMPTISKEISIATERESAHQEDGVWEPPDHQRISIFTLMMSVILKADAPFYLLIATMPPKITYVTGRELAQTPDTV